MALRPSAPLFARVVSLACHDMRTPLATVTGFAQTLPRVVQTDERGARYLELIEAAGRQLAALLDDLSLLARIETGRYEPVLRESDTVALAEAAAARTEDGDVAVTGEGASVAVEPDSVERALAHFARCILRHGGLERVDVHVDGREVVLSPVASDVAPIVLADELRDLGAAVAVAVVAALGGSSTVDGERLVVSLPAGSVS